MLISKKKKAIDSPWETSRCFPVLTYPAPLIPPAQSPWKMRLWIPKAVGEQSFRSLVLHLKSLLQQHPTSRLYFHPQPCLRFRPFPKFLQQSASWLVLFLSSSDPRLPQSNAQIHSSNQSSGGQAISCFPRQCSAHDDLWEQRFSQREQAPQDSFWGVYVYRDLLGGCSIQFGKELLSIREELYGFPKTNTSVSWGVWSHFSPGAAIFLYYKLFYFYEREKKGRGRIMGEEMA